MGKVKELWAEDRFRNPHKYEPNELDFMTKKKYEKMMKKQSKKEKRNAR